MSGREERSVAHIAAQAADWFVALREGELSARERERFSLWLEESPVHVREYLGVAGALGAVVGAQAWPAQDADELIGAARAQANVFSLPRERGRARVAAFRLRKPLAWAAALIVTIGVAWVAWDSRDVRRYATERGEQRSIVLADGSVVQLNTLSRLTVRFDERRRRIELPDGEAFFRVAKDAMRPFEVVTPFATIRAVGTEFNVYSRERETRVAVLEGRVQVALENAAAPSSIGLGEKESLQVDAGGRMTRTVTSPKAQATAWIQRRLVFENHRLDRAVEEFNRYNARQLQIVDPSLAALRISGVFDADDPGALVQYLERVQNAHALRKDDTLLLGRPSTR